MTAVIDHKFLAEVEEAGTTCVVKVNGSAIFKMPKMRLITLNCLYGWFVTSMVYYGLGLVFSK